MEGALKWISSSVWVFGFPEKPWCFVVLYWVCAGYSYLAELLLDKGYEVHGLKRRASSYNHPRLEHIIDFNRTRSIPDFFHGFNLTSLSIKFLDILLASSMHSLLVRVLELSFCRRLSKLRELQDSLRRPCRFQLSLFSSSVSPRSCQAPLVCLSMRDAR